MKSFVQVVLLCAVSTLSWARPQTYEAPDAPAYEQPAQSYEQPAPMYEAPGAAQQQTPSYSSQGQQGGGMPYEFHYMVNDNYGNDYGHMEKSDGNLVTGMYRVLLPDTRVMIVTYTADDQNGYQANVQFQGEAVVGNQGSGSGGYGQKAQAPSNTYQAPSTNTGYN